MPKYQGHKNWNHWNVALWINNDEGLYDLARQAIRDSTTYQRSLAHTLSRKRGDRSKAAAYFIDAVGTKHTPDGAPYTVSSVRAATVGMK